MFHRFRDINIVRCSTYLYLPLWSVSFKGVALGFLPRIQKSRILFNITLLLFLSLGYSNAVFPSPYLWLWPWPLFEILVIYEVKLILLFHIFQEALKCKYETADPGKHWKEWRFQDATFHCLFDLKLHVYMCFGTSDTVYAACVFNISSIHI